MSTKACLDMVALKKEARLCVLWMPSSENMYDVICSSFQQILLLRENIDLGYTLVPIEAT